MKEATCVAPAARGRKDGQGPYVLGGISGPTQAQILRERIVLVSCAASFNVSLAMMVSPRGKRGQDSLRALLSAYLLMDRLLESTSLRIGKLVRRDHSTVLYGQEAAVRRIARDPDFAEGLARAEARAASLLAAPDDGLAVVAEPVVEPVAAPARAEPPRRPRREFPVPLSRASDAFAGVRFEDHPASRPRMHSARVHVVAGDAHLAG